MYELIRYLGCHSALVGATLSEDSHRDAESRFPMKIIMSLDSCFRRNDVLLLYLTMLGTARLKIKGI